MGCEISRPAGQRAGAGGVNVQGQGAANPQQSGPPTYKLVLLGDTGAGKSCLVLRYARDEFDPASRVTVGAAFLAHNVRLEGHDDPIRLDIWDTAGQERYANLAPLYYRGAAAALVVFDVGSRRTFDRARHWIEELQSRATNPMVACLVGNKIDIAEGQREVSRAEAEACAEQMGMLYRETSAKTGEGVSETVEMVAEKAVRLRNLGFGAAPAAGGSGQASGAPHADTAPS